MIKFIYFLLLPEIEKEKTMHEKMYKIATKNGSTLTMGGSEEIQ